jgi:hypothetical protein
MSRRILKNIKKILLCKAFGVKKATANFAVALE